MALNWSTFAFEIVNFLILIWILQRFLYRPVLAVIAKRRSAIEKTLAEAQTLRLEAEALESQYRNRLAGWEQEKQSAREALGRDLQAERRHQLQTLHDTLAQERDKAQAVEQH